MAEGGQAPEDLKESLERTVEKGTTAPDLLQKRPERRVAKGGDDRADLHEPSGKTMIQGGEASAGLQKPIEGTMAEGGEASVGLPERLEGTMADRGEAQVDFEKCTNRGHGYAKGYCHDCKKHYCNSCWSGHQNYESLKPHNLTITEHEQTRLVSKYVEGRKKGRSLGACVENIAMKIRPVLDKCRILGTWREDEPLAIGQLGGDIDQTDTKLKCKILGELTQNRNNVVCLGMPCRIVEPLGVEGKVSGMVAVEERLCVIRHQTLWLCDMANGDNKKIDVPKLQKPEKMTLVKFEVAIIDERSQKTRYLFLVELKEETPEAQPLTIYHKPVTSINLLSKDPVELILGQNYGTEFLIWSGRSAQPKCLNTDKFPTYSPYCVLKNGDEGYIALKKSKNGNDAIIQWINEEGNDIATHNTGGHLRPTEMVQDKEGRLIVPGSKASLYVFEGHKKVSPYQTMNDGNIHSIYFDEATNRMYVASGQDENTEVILGYDWPPKATNMDVCQWLFCDQKAGMKKCRNCPLCSYVLEGDFVNDPWKRKYRIVHQLNCETSNAIYAILCKECDQFVYVGETARRLQERWVEHLKDIQKRRGGLWEHLHKHSIDNVGDICQVMGIEHVISGNDEERRGRESWWINKLWTADPAYGVNKLK